ncbi:MGH1-like glycoside hydrolase domain-containing protein [Actinomadura sediminis]|uniref:Mannosylglycerate hydrolase MGH1-like glycoside hydrolase domain-containing protein n=1 Tax=Actinomadura sediminis TaxID=1038904 RepID=A0ABW3EPJ0_9ACTN
MDRAVPFAGPGEVDVRAGLPPAMRPGPDERRRLAEAAVATLAGNWTGAATLPSRTQYPHQWSWDSAFIAIGLARVDQDRAQRELLGLLRAQWDTGRLPHIVYGDTEDESYFPGPGFWDSRGVPDAPAVRTSGIVQPPVHARAALTVCTRAGDEAAALRFLAEAYPKLAAQHRYLLERRDLDGGGLACIVHPWESGTDNSPAWDPFLTRFTEARSLFVRQDMVHVPADERPSDADYSAYIALAESYRDIGYDDLKLLDKHGFTVEDPLFNAILLDGELCLAEIARRLGRDPGPHLRSARAVHRGLMERLWDDERGTFVARDVRTGVRGTAATVSGFAPLLDPWLPADVRDRLVGLLLSPAFMGGCGHPVPTYDLREPNFDRRRYWRGPTWVNTNWLLWVGALRAGRPDIARTISASTLGLVGRSGFREYFDPVDGGGRGACDFSWSAALALDMLAADDGAVPLPSIVHDGARRLDASTPGRLGAMTGTGAAER